MTRSFHIAGVAAVASVLLLPTAGGTGNPGPVSPTGAGLPTVPDIVRAVEPPVVTIRTSIGLGSGVVYRAAGTIVTDSHAVDDQKKHPFRTVQMQFAFGSRVQASVVGVDDVFDVAVIRAARSSPPAAKFSPAVPEVGKRAVVLGGPLGSRADCHRRHRIRPGPQHASLARIPAGHDRPSPQRCRHLAGQLR